MINNDEPLTNTATGGGGAQLINHGTVSLTENRLLSVTSDNDVLCVAHSNTAAGGDTLPINNDTLYQCAYTACAILLSWNGHTRFRSCAIDVVCN